MRRCVLMFALFSFVLGLATSAGAKASHASPYTYRQTFGSAVRLLKVDLGLEVTEKDPEWGYVLFVYTSPESGKRKNNGSVSFVEQDGVVTVTLQIPSMPSYHERVILDKLKHKLQSEHGDPPKREQRPEPDDEDEEGDEGDDDPPSDGSKKS